MSQLPEKVQLAPSIVHFYSWPFVLASCMDEEGKPNIIAIASSSPCCLEPPAIGIAVGLARYSHKLIAERGEFGINIPRAADLEKADLTGCITGEGIDKFARVGFTPLPGLVIATPLIAECPVNLECKLVHTAHLGSHDWFIGEVVAARANADVVTSGNQVDPSRVGGVFSWMGQYMSPGERIAQWGFAMPR